MKRSRILQAHIDRNSPRREIVSAWKQILLFLVGVWMLLTPLTALCFIAWFLISEAAKLFQN